jgi:hypothetical protein
MNLIDLVYVNFASESSQCTFWKFSEIINT